MTVPMDGIRAIHNAFRKDIMKIDDAANTAAQGNGSLDFVEERYTFFNEILVWHAVGEEEFVFPEVEKVAPLVYEPYEQDHRGLDILYKTLDKGIKASDTLAVARATSTFKFHLDFHLKKEEGHLYRIFNERIALPEQGAIIGKMAQKIPQDRFPETIGWLFPLINLNDRVNMVTIWKQSLPGPAFAGAVNLIRDAIGEGWTELTEKVPDLA